MFHIHVVVIVVVIVIVVVVDQNIICCISTTKLSSRGQVIVYEYLVLIYLYIDLALYMANSVKLLIDSCCDTDDR